MQDLKPSQEEITQLLKTCDASKLCRYIEYSCRSVKCALDLFDSLMESKEMENLLPTSPLWIILSNVIPLPFMNMLTLAVERTNFDPFPFMSPYQAFFMKYIISIMKLSNKMGKLPELVRFLSNTMIPEPDSNHCAIHFCGLLDTKRLGIFHRNGSVDILKADAPHDFISTVQVESFGMQNNGWEMAKAEYESKLFSQVQTFFRSLDALHSLTSLPLSLYSAFINMMTAPDLRILSAIVTSGTASIAEHLVTIFIHAGAHRRLLKYCIYEEAAADVDESQIMRRNTLASRVVLEFIRIQLLPYVPEMFNEIKTQLAATPFFDLKAASEDDYAIIEATLFSFMKAIQKAISIMPSSIRFVCRCIYEAVTDHYKDEKMGQRGVFMVFMFRYIFPLLCQPQTTDPPDLEIDVKVMAKLPKLLTSLFSRETPVGIAHLVTIIKSQQATAQKILADLTVCPEQYDVVPQPPIDKTITAFNKIREDLQPKMRTLSFAMPNPPQIMSAWLSSML